VVEQLGQHPELLDLLDVGQTPVDLVDGPLHERDHLRLLR
jgi:hypothetical protein